MTTKLASALGTIMMAGGSATAAAQDNPPAIGEAERDAFAKILEFLNTIAEWLGQLIVQLIQFIVPNVTLPGSIVETMGILALITILLVMVDLARKLVWVVVGVGWVLIAIRIVMVITQSSGASS